MVGRSRGRRRGEHGQHAVAWLAALLVIGGLIAAPSGSATVRASAASTSTISVTGTTIDRPIPSGFVGLGLEYKNVPVLAGNNPKAIDPVFVRLTRNLTDGQHPILRIGGISTDRTWWPVHGMRQSPGLTYTLTKKWIEVTRALAQDTHARLILGINLEDNNTKVASTEAKELDSGIGSSRISALEIGNEPELYTVIPWYVTHNGQDLPWYQKRKGRPVQNRRPGYSFNDFTGEFSRFRKVLPHLPVAGPATGSFGWLTDLPHLLVAQSLRWVTFHRYGLNGCVSNTHSPYYATLPNLLGTSASRGIMNGVGKYVALAHKHHSGFLIDEMNSVTCGGRAGISNTFASALWALDAMFDMASNGVDGVQIHTFQGNENSLFDFHQSQGTWTAQVRPEYYGLLMFAQAAPPGSRLLAIHAPNDSSLREWATRGRDGRVRVVLINDSLSRSSSLDVKPPISASSVTLTRLSAHNAYATGGVTLGGQSFGSETTTGNLSGNANVTTLKAVNGAYPVSLPAASAAMITFSPTTSNSSR